MLSSRRSPTFKGLLELFRQPETHNTQADADEIFVQDWEDQGFQASYSRLAASEPVKSDPVAWAGPDARLYLARQIAVSFNEEDFSRDFRSTSIWRVS